MVVRSSHLQSQRGLIELGKLLNGIREKGKEGGGGGREPFHFSSPPLLPIRTTHTSGKNSFLLQQLAFNSSSLSVGTKQSYRERERGFWKVKYGKGGKAREGSSLWRIRKVELNFPLRLLFLLDPPPFRFNLIFALSIDSLPAVVGSKSLSLSPSSLPASSATHYVLPSSSPATSFSEFLFRSRESSSLLFAWSLFICTNNSGRQADRRRERRRRH